MDLLSVGSANQYAKNMARRTQWNLKKRSGDFTAHGKSLGDYVNFTKASSVLPQTDEADRKMSAIMTKAQSGRKLSPDDWDYLRVKNPALYEKLREVEKEQEDYEKALRRCKTQDEARRLHMSKLGEIMSAAKNGDESALFRLNRLTRTMTDFANSDEYRRMPTEAEEAIERESERRAKAEALREEAALQEAAREAAEDGETESGVEPDAESVPETSADAEIATAPLSAALRRHLPSKGGDKGASIETGAKPVTNAKLKPVTGAKAKPVTDAKRDLDAPSGVSFGQRAYMSQRDAKSRRRALDAKA